MDNISINLLNDKFNMYYENAKRAMNEGNAELAKRNYMLAAETLLKLAKLSSPELKSASRTGETLDRDCGKRGNVHRKQAL